MPLSYSFLFFLSTLGSFTLLLAGLNYYLRTREDALTRRVEESLAFGGDDRRSEFAACKHGHFVTPVP